MIKPGPHAALETTALEWVNAKSTTAQRMLKYAFNLIDDELVGRPSVFTDRDRSGPATAHGESLTGRRAVGASPAPSAV